MLGYNGYYRTHPDYMYEANYRYDRIEQLIDNPPDETLDNRLWEQPRHMIRDRIESVIAEDRARREAMRKDFDGLDVHIWDDIRPLKPGTYTERYVGSSAIVARCMNDFHKTAQKAYPGRVSILDISVNQMANGTAAFITFQIH